MKAEIIFPDRDVIIRVLERETGETAEYIPLPFFSYRVGGYTVSRDGHVYFGDDEKGAVGTLVSLGLCRREGREEAEDTPDGPFSFDVGKDGRNVMYNLLCILSARQKMLNPALGGRFFYVSKKLMNDLSAHPPESVPALLSALYGRERELVGVRFSKTRVTFTGFGKTPPGREKSPEQLCRLLVRAAERQKWVKPHACRMREPRSALRAWLNSVGATGPEYDGLREALLRSERVENAHSSEE